MKKAESFQHKIMRIFLPVILSVILLSGLLLYFLSTRQVEDNARYLIANTTRQTANLIDAKLKLTLEQCTKLNQTLAIWRMVNNSYQANSTPQQNSDLIEVNRALEQIYNDSDGAVDSIAFHTAYNIRMNLYYGAVSGVAAIPLETIPAGISQKALWKNVHEDDIFQTPQKREVFSMILPYADNNGQCAAVLWINFRADYFRSMLNEAEISPNGYAFLLSEDGALFPFRADEKNIPSASQLEMLRNEESSSFSFRQANRSFECYATAMDINQWKTIALVNRSDLYSTISSFTVLFVTILIASVLIAAAISILSARVVSKPLRSLVSQIERFEQDRNMSFSVQGSSEVMALAGELNHLKNRIDGLLLEVSEEQAQKADLEMMIMQSQLKPHFLYNTLRSIKMLSGSGENEKAAAMCEALIQFYRGSLSNGSFAIPLQKEIELNEKYLEILKYRYGDQFEYLFDVSEEAGQIDIPKMSLQPLIENAVYHGLKPKDGAGMVLLKARLRNGALRITIFDDGIGMNAERLNQVRDSLAQRKMLPDGKGGFGLANVFMRLKGFYGNRVEMTVDSLENVHTQIDIVIKMEQE